MIRVRIAPSPTGYPHIGTIYQALFDFAFARKNNGKFIIRIEDTDQSRFVSDAEEKLYQAIDWFSLPEDESPRKGGPFGPYAQSKRLTHYQEKADYLLQQGFAYYCFCTKERLEELKLSQQKMKQPIFKYDKRCRNLSIDEVVKKREAGSMFVIRLKVPENETIVAKDEIRGEISFDANLVDDQVLIKADGFPTYHLAVVVDDHAMEISDVVRGEEWIPSFPKHVLLYTYFNWKLPRFYHTPALRNPDKSKLSKRQGHTNIRWYQEEGYLPQAILNYIALLGWSHPQEKEIFPLTEFIKEFELKDIKPIGPIFDLQKLTWMNGEYIRQMSVSELKNKLNDFFANDPAVQRFFHTTEIHIDDIVNLAKTRIKTLKELKDLLVPHTVVLSEKEREIAAKLREQLSSLPDWHTDSILAILKALLAEYQVKMHVFYTILTGKEKGLPLPEFLEAISKKETLQRLKSIA